jgi:hypothetical protein
MGLWKQKPLGFKPFQGQWQRYEFNFIWKWMHFEMNANIKNLAAKNFHIENIIMLQCV